MRERRDWEEEQRRHSNWEEERERLQKYIRPTETEIYCGLCYSVVKQKKRDKQRREMPWCQVCDVYFLPYWEFDEKTGTIHVNFMPKTEYEKIKDLKVVSAIPEKQKMKNDSSVERHQKAASDSDTIPNPSKNRQEDDKQPKHKDVAGQILKILTENNRHFKTGELVQQIQVSRQSVMVTLKKLVDKKQIKKIKHGVYAIKKEK